MTKKQIEFDEVIDRRLTNCAKWDSMDQKYGGNDLIHLGVADMDFKAPQPILDSFNRTVTHGVFGYTELDTDFPNSIITWMKKHHDLNIEQNEIVFCPRITIAASIAIKYLTEVGDSVIINSPAYSPLKEAITLNNRKVIESPLKQDINNIYAIDFEDLEAKVGEHTRMFILCSPHNPTGMVWAKEDLVKLMEFCERHNLIVFSDEIHSDILAKGTSFTSILRLSKAFDQRVIMASSITKTFNVPGIIISHMIIPNKDIRKKIEHGIKCLGMNNPNIFSLAAMKPAYEDCDEWLENINLYIDDNYAVFKDFIDVYMNGFKVLERYGTYLAWVDCRALNISENDLEQWFINDAKVSVYMGSMFGDKGRGFIRVNLATSMEVLLDALNRMKTEYHKLL